MSVIDKFLKYVAYDTQSSEIPEDGGYPSTKKQLVLCRELCRELREMGIAAAMDEYGYVTARIPANTEGVPKLGFLAHVDTSPDVSGENVKAKIITYTGGEIVLNEEKKIVMRESDFPALKYYVGEELIVTDGTTLLGADDKAGVAEIMEMAQRLTDDPEIPHGEIIIGFTVDEEVGTGTEYFDVASFGADIAYTVDGGAEGEVEYENFNAASAKVTINGVNIHPGSAKNKMKNAVLIGIEFNEMLPRFEIPAYTEGYEGFSHLCDFNGDVENTVLAYIIRDHDKDKFEAKKARFVKIADYLNEKYGEGTIELDIADSYYNMKELILPHFDLVENALAAMAQAGLQTKTIPIRGGTDGARLSYMGLPCPNLSTGGFNAHGRFEFASVSAMKRCTEVLMNIIAIYAQKK